MWHNLSKQKQQLIAAIAVVFTIYLAYILSFKKTIDAYILNRGLQREISLASVEVEYGPLNKKHLFYKMVLKEYKTRKGEFENKSWQALSDMAVVNNVKINYSPPKILDTTNSVPGIRTQQFVLTGQYFNLLKLLDTLSRENQVGKIKDFEMSVPRNLNSGDLRAPLSLKLMLTAIEK